MSEESYQSEVAQRSTTNIMDEVEDDNSSCDSIDIVNTVLKNNGQESSKLSLEPSRGSQRIIRQSSRLLSRFTRKKSTNENFSNHSSHPISRGKKLPNKTLPNLHNSVHGAKLTEMIQANFGSATPSTADVTQMLRANTLNGELTDKASPLPRPQAHLERTSSMRLSSSGVESVMESHEKSTFSILSSTTSCGYESSELVIKTNPQADTVAILQSFGDSPSTHELDKLPPSKLKSISANVSRPSIGRNGIASRISRKWIWSSGNS